MESAVDVVEPSLLGCSLISVRSDASVKQKQRSKLRSTTSGPLLSLAVATALLRLTRYYRGAQHEQQLHTGVGLRYLKPA
jgi:hypothetical protein